MPSSLGHFRRAHLRAGRPENPIGKKEGKLLQEQVRELPQHLDLGGKRQESFNSHVWSQPGLYSSCDWQQPIAPQHHAGAQTHPVLACPRLYSHPWQSTGKGSRCLPSCCLQPSSTCKLQWQNWAQLGVGVAALPTWGQVSAAVALIIGRPSFGSPAWREFHHPHL